MPAWLTVLIGGLLTAAPQYVPMLPHEVQGALTAVFAVATSMFHLFQPAPGTLNR